MTTGERTTQVFNRIHDQIDYFRMEYGLTTAEMVGVLEMVKLDIYNGAYDKEEG